MLNRILVKHSLTIVYEFHKIAVDELDAFDYETYKKNGFKVDKLGDFPLKLETKPE